MSTTVKMHAGRITLPAEIRRSMGLSLEETFEVEECTDQDALILRPAAILRREDAWAYTPEHREKIAKARAQIAAGQGQRLSEQDLIDLVGGEVE